MASLFALLFLFLSTPPYTPFSFLFLHDMGHYAHSAGKCVPKCVDSVSSHMPLCIFFTACATPPSSPPDSPLACSIQAPT